MNKLYKELRIININYVNNININEVSTAPEILLCYLNHKIKIKVFHPYRLAIFSMFCLRNHLIYFLCSVNYLAKSCRWTINPSINDGSFSNKPLTVACSMPVNIAKGKNSSNEAFST